MTQSHLIVKEEGCTKPNCDCMQRHADKHGLDVEQLKSYECFGGPRLIEHTAEKESPEIDKEEDELVNFLEWFNDSRWSKDIETYNWIRKFSYKEPEILTSKELAKLYRSIHRKP